METMMRTESSVLETIFWHCETHLLGKSCSASWGCARSALEASVALYGDEDVRDIHLYVCHEI